MLDSQSATGGITQMQLKLFSDGKSHYLQVNFIFAFGRKWYEQDTYTDHPSHCSLLDVCSADNRERSADDVGAVELLVPLPANQSDANESKRVQRHVQAAQDLPRRRIRGDH